MVLLRTVAGDRKGETCSGRIQSLSQCAESANTAWPPQQGSTDRQAMCEQLLAPALLENTARSGYWQHERHVIIIIIRLFHPGSGYRPPRRALHLSLFCAIFSISRQLCPICLRSASKSRSQVALGLPLFRFPCGFHLRLCLVTLSAGFLRVCPIHLHLLFLISCSIGCCLVFLHRTTFLIVSGQ